MTSNSGSFRKTGGGIGDATFNKFNLQRIVPSEISFGSCDCENPCTCENEDGSNLSKASKTQIQNAKKHEVVSCDCKIPCSCEDEEKAQVKNRSGNMLKIDIPIQDLSSSVCECKNPCLCPKNEDSIQTEGIQVKVGIPIQDLSSSVCECKKPCSCPEDQEMIENEGFLLKVGIPSQDLSSSVCECKKPCSCPKKQEMIETEGVLVKVGIPVQDLSASGCECKNPCLCENHEDSVPEEDQFEKFIRKLEENLVENQKKYCFEVFGKYSKKTGKKRVNHLTEKLIFDYMLEDLNGKPVIYLPGNQLCPHVITERLQNKDMLCLKNVLLDLNTISTLSIPYNNVGDDGIEILSSVLHKLENLEHLNLMHNEIGTKGILSLGRSIFKKRIPFKSLRLTGNKFGDEGMDGLSCIVLGGGCPSMLDISETDFGPGGFQSFCSCLIALDKEDFFPSHFETRRRQLPIDFDELKEIRLVNQIYQRNKRKQDLYGMNLHKRMLRNEDFILNPNLDHETILNVKLPNEDMILPEEIQEKVPSSKDSVLASFDVLFDMENIDLMKNNVKMKSVNELEKDYPKEIIDEIQRKAFQDESKDGNLSETIRTFNFVTKRKIVPNQINTDNIFTRTGSGSDNLSSSSFPQIRHNSIKTKDEKAKLILQERSKRKLSSTQKESTRILREKIAMKASNKFLIEIFNESSEQIAHSEYDNVDSDLLQLLLMNICEIVNFKYSPESITESTSTQKKDDQLILTDEDCKNILEEAQKSVYSILEPPLFQELVKSCGKQESEKLIKSFISKLFDSTEDTFLNILQNPFVLKAVHEVGISACKAKFANFPQSQDETSSQDVRSTSTEILSSYSNPLHVLSSFIDGIFEETGRLIGSTDPFNYKKTPNRRSSPPSIDEPLNFEEDHPLVSLVHDLIEIGEGIAQETDFLEHDALNREKHALIASEAIVEKLFEFGQEMALASEILQESIENEFPDLENDENFGKPHRLLLNRPLFGSEETVGMMAMLLGDYLRDNDSVKELFISKWNLGETGMIQLMEGLLGRPNVNIVLLDLSNNGFGPEGASLLSNYVKVNKNLRHLILSYNHLKDVGIKEIGKALVEVHETGTIASSLQTLNIAYNQITQIGLDYLMSQLKYSNVTTFLCWGNSFGQNTLKMFQELAENEQFQCTDVLIEKNGDELGSIVKNTKIRDVNHIYEVPPKLKKNTQELIVPEYLKYPLPKNIQASKN